MKPMDATRTARLRDLATLAIPLLVLTAGGGALDLLAPLKVPFQPPKEPPKAMRRIADGSAMRGYEEDRYIVSRMAAASRPVWNEFLYTAFRETPSRVVAGKAGWLFWNGGNFLPSLQGAAEAELRAKAEFAGAVNAALADRGVRLVALLTPDKARIHPEMVFKNGRLPEAARDVHRRFLGDLRAAGVLVFDAEAAMLGIKERNPSVPLYGSSDTHWLDFAVKPFAAEFADFLSRSGVLNEVPETPGFAARFYEERPPARPVEGNLVEMVGLSPRGFARQRLLFEETPRRLMDRVTGGPAGRFPGAPIMLMGSSFTHWNHAMFPETLALLLNRPVEHHSVSADRQLAEMKLFVEGLTPDHTRSLVIWEIHLTY